MICPKCADVMQTYDRAGVHIEQCAACGGIFLDRGELEALFSAEHEHYAEPARPAAARPEPASEQLPRYEPPARGRQEDRYREPRWERDQRVPRERRPYDWLDERDRHGGYDRHGRPRKKKDFLQQLFDF